MPEGVIASVGAAGTTGDVPSAILTLHDPATDLSPTLRIRKRNPLRQSAFLAFRCGSGSPAIAAATTPGRAAPFPIGAERVRGNIHFNGAISGPAARAADRPGNIRKRTGCRENTRKEKAMVRVAGS